MSDFSTVLVLDSKIADITPEVVYAVKQGGASNTYQSFKAVSQSPTNVVHNIQVPSESVLVARDPVIKTVMTITSNVTLPATQAAADRLDLSTFCVKAFPFNSSITTVQCNINNTTVSSNLSDIRQILFKLTKLEEFQHYKYGSPILPDIYYDYTTNAGINNVYGLFSNTATHGDNYIAGNKAFKYNLTFTLGGGAVGVIPANHALSAAGILSCTAAVGALACVFTWTITTFEPLIGLSPFLWSCNNEYNNAALAGINGLNFNFNLDSSAKDVLITTSAAGAAGSMANNNNLVVNKAAITNIDSTMIFNFISTQPTQLINAKNVVPYQDFPRYISTSSQTIAANGTVRLSSSSIQINQIPDYFIIAVRQKSAKPSADGTTIGNPERYLNISSISVNFNNSSGLLSSVSDNYELWRMSVRNGSCQDYNEFVQEIDFEYNTAVAAAGTATINKKLLLGPILVLDPTDLSLPAYLASGSIGQYIFQIDLVVTNLSTSAVTPEIIIICVNSGVFTTVAGSSSISTALLSKQVVMQTSQGQASAPLSRNLYDRMVGGSLQNRVSSCMRRMMPRTGGIGGVSSGGSKKSGLDNYC